MPVQVVTDSTADLAPEVAAGLGITVVPLKVIFGETSYRDRIDITDDEFYQRLTTGKESPKTSQPSAGEFQETYRRLLESGSEIISVHVSGKLSGTYNSAVLGSQAAGGTIRVIDTGLASLALGLVVIRVAKAAKAGATLEQLSELAVETANQTEIMFMVDTLEYLQRGGRIGRAQAFVGTLLNVKPILRVEDGEVRPVERVRTRARAIDRLFAWLVDGPNPSAIAVLSSPPRDDALTLASRILEAFPRRTVLEGVVGPVVGSHGGPGIVGVARFTGPSFD